MHSRQTLKKVLQKKLTIFQKPTVTWYFTCSYDTQIFQRILKPYVKKLLQKEPETIKFVFTVNRLQLEN